MASTSGLHLDIVLAGANHGVRDMASGRGQDDDGWGIRQTKVVRFGECAEVGRGSQADGDVLLSQAVAEGGSGRCRGWRNGLGRGRWGIGPSAGAEARLTASTAIGSSRATACCQ